MRLDITTLSLLLCTQLLVLALALPSITGWRVSTPMRWAIGGLWVQMLSWLLVLITPWVGYYGGTAPSYVAGVLTFVMTLQALDHWVGPRPGLKLAWCLPVLMTVTVYLGKDDAWLRQGLSNVWMGLGVLMLGLGLLWPNADNRLVTQRWRLVLAVPILGLMALTFLRAQAGLFDPENYPSLRSNNPVSFGVMLLANFSAICSALAYLAAWRGEADAKLLQLAQSDPLTGLANRRALDERAGEMLASAKRFNEPVVVMMLDIDHFKRINDSHGHDVGDRALVLMGQVMAEIKRPGDFAARWGGEEFVLVLARTGAEGAMAIDERLRVALLKQSEASLGFAVNYSAGFAQLRPGDRHVHDMLKRADAALYEAKRAGRGRLMAEPGEGAAKAQTPA